MARPSEDAEGAPRIGDAAVREKTGRDWAQWFELLDSMGAHEMDHRGIVALVAGEGIPAWWQQAVTVEYEKQRGLRTLHQQGKRFQVSRSKTVAVPVQELFDAWNQQQLREKWLPEPVEVRKSTPGKSLRITWLADDTSVDVYLVEKDAERSQVSVQQSKLPDEASARRQGEFWAEALGRLRQFLEGSRDQAEG